MTTEELKAMRIKIAKGADLEGRMSSILQKIKAIAEANVLEIYVMRNGAVAQIAIKEAGQKDTTTAWMFGPHDGLTKEILQKAMDDLKEAILVEFRTRYNKLHEEFKAL